MWQYNYEPYLCHYGVKGMKWGVRKEYKPHPRKKKRQDTKDDDSKRKKGLSTKQKRAVAIGAAAVATALAAYGGYKLYKSGKLDGILDKVKTKSPIQFKDGLQLQKGQSSIDDNLKKINPNYSLFNKKSYMNCGNCSLAFEARMRGYDVTARGNSTGMRLSQLGEFFTGLNSNSFHEVDLDLPQNRLLSKKERGEIAKNAVKSTISKSYDGDARGTIYFTHDYGAHFFSWVKNGNDIKFYDAQNPKQNLDNVFSMYKRWPGVNQTTVVRLDDLGINTNNIKEVIKNTSNKITPFNEQVFDTWKTKGENFVMKMSGG